MKKNIYYGKLNKNGDGDIDILLAKNVEPEEVEKVISENAHKMVSGWSSVKDGDYIEVDVYNAENELENELDLDLDIQMYFLNMKGEVL